MNFWQVTVRRVEKKYRIVYKRGPSRIAFLFAVIAVCGWLFFLVLSGYPLVQYVFYRLRPSTSAELAQNLTQVKTEPTQVVKAAESPDDKGLPPVDVSKPDGRYVMIPSIGVDSVIWEAPEDDYEKVLKKGVWRVPDLADPTSGKPVLLVAHRFGYIDWTQEYREKNSFFNLPKLKPGDTVEILWDKRLFRYRIDRISEGEKIETYATDLILYTCKFLVSPVRIFAYATKVN